MGKNDEALNAANERAAKLESELAEAKKRSRARSEKDKSQVNDAIKKAKKAGEAFALKAAKYGTENSQMLDLALSGGVGILKGSGNYSKIPAPGKKSLGADTAVDVLVSVSSGVLGSYLQNKKGKTQEFGRLASAISANRRSAAAEEIGRRFGSKGKAAFEEG